MYKNIKFFAFILTLGFATGFLISCNNDDGGGDDLVITEEERVVLEDLVGDWTISDVTQDGEAPQVGDYSNLSLTINADVSTGSGKTYSVTGGDLAFQDASDAPWSFVEGSNYEVMQLQGERLMRITERDGTNLKLQTEVTEELQDGRVATVGIYVFTFTK